MTRNFQVMIFLKNAGYGTAKHLEGLEKYGVTPIHRTSFEPIKSIIQKLVKDN